MNEPTRRPRHKRLLGALALVLLTPTTSACMHRRALSQGYLDRVILKTNEDANRIRLYVNRRLILKRRDTRDAGKHVRDKVHIRGRKKHAHEVTGRWTKGRLLKIDERDGATVLWVSFQPTCADERCAYAFAAADGGERFRLIQVPENPTFDEQRVIGRDWGIARTLELGFVETLSETNQVYRGVGYGERVVTVDLDLIERWRPKRMIRIYNRGVGKRGEVDRQLVPKTGR